jgi:hypothetical protein
MHHATAATTSPTDEHATFVQLGGNERRDGCGGYIGSGDHATTATAAGYGFRVPAARLKRDVNGEYGKKTYWNSKEGLYKLREKENEIFRLFSKIASRLWSSSSYY